MSKSVEVTNSTWPSTGTSASKNVARERAAEEERHRGRAGGDRHAGAEQSAGVGGGGRAELVAPAGDVAHDERHARDEAAGEAAAGALWPANSR